MAAEGHGGALGGVLAKFGHFSDELVTSDGKRLNAKFDCLERALYLFLDGTFSLKEVDGERLSKVAASFERQRAQVQSTLAADREGQLESAERDRLHALLGRLDAVVQDASRRLL